MFRHYWPENNCCDKCGTMRSGAMLYISDVPVSFVCEVCSPAHRNAAVDFAHDLANEEELNGWNWLTAESP